MKYSAIVSTTEHHAIIVEVPDAFAHRDPAPTEFELAEYIGTRIRPERLLETARQKEHDDLQAGVGPGPQTDRHIHTIAPASETDLRYDAEFKGGWKRRRAQTPGQRGRS